MEGWISLYRSIQENWIWQDEKYLKWWLTILLNVNHERKFFPVGPKIYACEPGQSFRSIEQWTDMFSCSKKTTIKFFNLLKDSGMIKCQIVGNGNRRKHLLTVVNWNVYQKTETENYTERTPEYPPKEYSNVPPNNKDNKENNGIKDIKGKFSFKNSLLALGIDEIVASDWLTVRKQKKAANTETAFNAIKREIEQSGLSANNCIKTAVENSWQGFKAEWLKKARSYQHPANSLFNNESTNTQINKF